jgi:hypothetical protein
MGARGQSRQFKNADQGSKKRGRFEMEVWSMALGDSLRCLRFDRRMILTWVWGMLAASSAARAEEETAYRFSPVNQYGINLTAAYWNPIISYVSEKSGVRLQLKIGRTSADTTAYVLAQEVEFVFSNHLFSPERERLGWKVFARRATPPVFAQIIVPEDSPITELAQLDFVRRRDDLVITGKSGTGKSHILMALGRRACEHQISVRYARCVDLLDDLYAGLADGSYARRLKAWARPDLLIIDDVGLGQVKKRDDEPTAAHTLFNLIDRRHGKASTAITSNVALSDWGRYLGDATVAMAILDRLAMLAIRIDIDGPSYRKHVGEQRAKTKTKTKKS